MRWEHLTLPTFHKVFVFVFRVCVFWDVKKNIKTCKRRRRRWRSVEKFQKSWRDGKIMGLYVRWVTRWNLTKNPSHHPLNHLIFSTKCYSLNNNKMGWSSLIFSLAYTKIFAFIFSSKKIFKEISVRWKRKSRGFFVSWQHTHEGGAIKNHWSERRWMSRNN